MTIGLAEPVVSSQHVASMRFLVCQDLRMVQDPSFLKKHGDWMVCGEQREIHAFAFGNGYLTFLVLNREQVGVLACFLVAYETIVATLIQWNE